MPPSTSTTAAKPLPPRKWGFTVRNNSDTNGLHPPEQNVATSGDIPACRWTQGGKDLLPLCQRNRNSIALIAIHGGSGNKSLVYDFLETQLQAVFGGGESSTLVNSDIQIGAVEVKTADDAGRRGRGHGLSSASNALAVGGQLGGFTLTPSATFTRPRIPRPMPAGIW